MQTCASYYQLSCSERSQCVKADVSVPASRRQNQNQTRSTMCIYTQECTMTHDYLLVSVYPLIAPTLIYDVPWTSWFISMLCLLHFVTVGCMAFFIWGLLGSTVAPGPLASPYGAEVLLNLLHQLPYQRHQWQHHWQHQWQMCPLMFRLEGSWLGGLWLVSLKRFLLETIETFRYLKMLWQPRWEQGLESHNRSSYIEDFTNKHMLFLHYQLRKNIVHDNMLLHHVTSSPDEQHSMINSPREEPGYRTPQPC